MVIFNAIAVIAYLLFAGYLLRTNKEHLVLFGYFSFMSAWALVSCFYNDLGIFNLELFRYTEPTYATAHLAGYYIVFNFGFLFMARLAARRPLSRMDYTLSHRPLQLGHFKLAAYSAAALIGLYIVYTFINDGIPLFTGMNRLEYFKQAGFVERKLIFYASPIAFILGYFRRKQGRFSVNGVMIAAFILFAILVGNKFSLLVTLLVSYFVPVYIRYQVENPEVRLFTRRRMASMTAVIGILLLLTFGAYYHVFKDLSSAYNLLVNRVFAFQGQMWWAVDYDVTAEGRYDNRHWQVELNNLLSPDETSEGAVGMKYLMVQVLGPEKAYSIFDAGYLYTHTYPAILIATFPPAIAVMIQFLAGMGFFILLFYLYYSVKYRHALRAVITMLIVMPYLGTLFSGNFATFFTFGMLLKIAIIILLEIGAPRQSSSAPSPA